MFLVPGTEAELLARTLIDRLEQDVRQRFPKTSLYLAGYGTTLWRVVVSVGIEEKPQDVLHEVREQIIKINRQEERGFRLWATTM